MLVAAFHVNTPLALSHRWSLKLEATPATRPMGFRPSFTRARLFGRVTALVGMDGWGVHVMVLDVGNCAQTISPAHKWRRCCVKQANNERRRTHCTNRTSFINRRPRRGLGPPFRWPGTWVEGGTGSPSRASRASSLGRPHVAACFRRGAGQQNASQSVLGLAMGEGLPRSVDVETGWLDRRRRRRTSAVAPPPKEFDARGRRAVLPACFLFRRGP